MQIEARFLGDSKVLFETQSEASNRWFILHMETIASVSLHRTMCVLQGQRSCRDQVHCSKSRWPGCQPMSNCIRHIPRTKHHRNMQTRNWQYTLPHISFALHQSPLVKFLPSNPQLQAQRLGRQNKPQGQGMKSRQQKNEVCVYQLDK